MTFTLPPQTTSYSGEISKESLSSAFVGKTLRDLRTPAMVIDRAVFAENCTKMHERAKLWSCLFRAHVKTHKTAEGTRLQLQTSSDKTKSVIVSTLREAWSLVQAGLVSDGTINDILYGLPVAINKIADLNALAEEIRPHGGIVRLMIDSPDQVRALEVYNQQQSTPASWSAFFKVDLGTTKRAGLVPSTPGFESLLRQLLESPAIALHGFYCHAGTSYASTTLDEASAFLTAEVTAVIDAATLAQKIGVSSARSSVPWVLSVGSTPTAHAFSESVLTTIREKLDACNSTLELHAGNYPMLDLQQLATSLIPSSSIAQRVLATVISYYPGRGEGGKTDEAMCDAGGIAMSKDKGPIPGFGEVVRIIPASASGSSASTLSNVELGWRLGRVSQEHGILTRKDLHTDTVPEEEKLHLGDVVEIVGQHACLIAAAYPWYYITDSSNGAHENVKPGDERVVDVWVPFKGW